MSQCIGADGPMIEYAIKPDVSLIAMIHHISQAPCVLALDTIRLTSQRTPFKKMQAYFIRNNEHPNGIINQITRSMTTCLPRPPQIMKPPRYPETAKTSISNMQGLILITRFDCVQNCRSFGICSHYQFCCGVRNCPDGLICDRCVGVAPEKVC